MWGYTSRIAGVGAGDVIVWEVEQVSRKPKRPCAKVGCGELVENGFCFQHQSECQKIRAEKDKYYDKHKRNKQSEQFYKSRAWQAVRLRALTRDNFLCVDCLEDNRITQADTVHHRVPISVDWSKRLDIDNLISLCAACHNARHARG